MLKWVATRRVLALGLRRRRTTSVFACANTNMRYANASITLSSWRCGWENRSAKPVPFGSRVNIHAYSFMPPDVRVPDLGPLTYREVYATCVCGVQKINQQPEPTIGACCCKVVACQSCDLACCDLENAICSWKSHTSQRLEWGPFHI